MFKEMVIDRSSDSLSAAGCCGSDTTSKPVEVMHPACCDPGPAGAKVVDGADMVVPDIDFNDWVGRLHIFWSILEVID